MVESPRAAPQPEAGPSRTSDAPPALKVLHSSAPAAGLIWTNACQAVASRLATRTESVLWIEGPAGSGKSTAVGEALRRCESTSTALRVECFRGMRLEEVLYEIAAFLRQIGSPRLAAVLDQRTSMRAKWSVFLEVLETTPILLWIDDAHFIEAGCLPLRLDGLGRFLETLAVLDQSAQGRVVLTAEAAPPGDSGLTSLVLPPFSKAEAQKLWTRLHESAAESPAAVENSTSRAEVTLEAALPDRLVDDPLGLRVAYALSRADPRNAENLRDICVSFEHCANRSIDTITQSARACLLALAAFGRPLSRGAVRTQCHAVQEKADLDALVEEGPLGELLDSSLVEASRDEHGRPIVFRIPASTRTVIEKRIAESESKAWKELKLQAAHYHLRLATRQGGFWRYHAARDRFYQAGHFDEACQVHKCYVEDLLRLGYFDLARCVLSQTVETTEGNTRAVTLGNLAIIHKNAGEYDRALELYESAEHELTELGDRCNVARVLHQIGNVHYLRERFHEAINSYLESAEISKELGEILIASATRVQIGNVLYQLGEEEDALRHYHEIVQDLRAAAGDENNPGMLAAVQVQIGQIHQKAGRPMEAAAALDEAERGIRPTDDRRSLIKVLRARALLLREQHEYERAIDLYAEATEAASGLGDRLELTTCHVLRGDLERNRMQLGKALEHYRDATRLLRSAETRRVSDEEQLRSAEELLESRLQELRDIMGGEAFERAAKKLQAASDPESKSA